MDEDSDIFLFFSQLSCLIVEDFISQTSLWIKIIFLDLSPPLATADPPPLEADMFGSKATFSSRSPRCMPLGEHSVMRVFGFFNVEEASSHLKNHLSFCELDRHVHSSLPPPVNLLPPFLPTQPLSLSLSFFYHR